MAQAPKGSSALWGATVKLRGNIAVRDARFMDIDGFKGLASSIWGSPESIAAEVGVFNRGVSTSRSRNKQINMVAESGGELVGYAALRETAADIYYLTIGVTGAYRRRGIGESLLTGMIGRARRAGLKEVFLEVDMFNQVARALYEKSGFRYVSMEPDEYNDLTMVMDLK
jgi:ribosomal protein S18 acetylase RimI-like enzyme